MDSPSKLCCALFEGFKPRRDLNALLTIIPARSPPPARLISSASVWARALSRPYAIEHNYTICGAAPRARE
jgi:hypothetical protein